MFRTQGLIYRKTVVTSTGTVQYMSICMVHPGSLKCGCGEITIRDVNKIPKYNICEFKYNNINI